MRKTYFSLADAGFQRLFTEFERTAYRLELLQSYDVSYEQDAYDRFLSGEDRGVFPGIDEWADLVSSGVRDGKKFQRVHVVVEPLSDYVRFECQWGYRHSVRAGEDVRVIPVKAGDRVVAERFDYWLFDDSVMAVMNYSDDGVFVSAEVTDDADRVASAVGWKVSAVNQSVPFIEYAERSGLFA